MQAARSAQGMLGDSLPEVESTPPPKDSPKAFRDPAQLGDSISEEPGDPDGKLPGNKQMTSLGPQESDGKTAYLSRGKGGGQQT